MPRARAKVRVDGQVDQPGLGEGALSGLGCDLAGHDAGVPQAPGLDPGEDLGNGVLDIEDTNGNGVLDVGEDLNGNGILDTEDANGNGVLDTEDTNGDGVLDLGNGAGLRFHPSFFGSYCLLL